MCVCITRYYSCWLHLDRTLRPSKTSTYSRARLYIPHESIRVFTSATLHYNLTSAPSLALKYFSIIYLFIYFNRTKKFYFFFYKKKKRRHTAMITNVVRLASFGRHLARRDAKEPKSNFSNRQQNAFARRRARPTLGVYV